MSTVEQIRANLARAKQRVAEIQAGARGVHSGAWQEVDGVRGAGLAHSNQLRAQEAAVARLELEYVHAMLPRWGATAVIERMEAK